jgi:hypothetical protein
MHWTRMDWTRMDWTTTAQRATEMDWTTTTARMAGTKRPSVPLESTSAPAFHDASLLATGAQSLSRGVPRM